MKSEILVKKNPRISFMTYGCRANQYDTAVLEKQVKIRGWKIVSESDQADYYVVNSCAITHNADDEARRYLGKIHRKNPEAVLVVAGCSAQVQPEFFKNIEGVALVVGNDHKVDLVHSIEKHLQGDSKNLDCFAQQSWTRNKRMDPPWILGFDEPELIQ